MIAIDGTRAEIATLRTPDGHGRIELDRFHEVVDYKDIYRLCYVRGPEGIIVGIAQERG